jgi:hypothetical protein
MVCISLPFLLITCTCFVLEFRMICTFGGGYVFCSIAVLSSYKEAYWGPRISMELASVLLLLQPLAGQKRLRITQHINFLMDGNGSMMLIIIQFGNR